MIEMSDFVYTWIGEFYCACTMSQQFIHIRMSPLSGILISTELKNIYPHLRLNSGFRILLSLKYAFYYQILERRYGCFKDCLQVNVWIDDLVSFYCDVLGEKLQFPFNSNFQKSPVSIEKTNKGNKILINDTIRLD